MKGPRYLTGRLRAKIQQLLLGAAIAPQRGHVDEESLKRVFNEPFLADLKDHLNFFQSESQEGSVRMINRLSTRRGQS